MLYANTSTSTTATSGTVTLSDNASDYQILQIWLYQADINTFFIINNTVSNRSSNFRNYYDGKNYINYVGSASYGKSFSWTTSTAINLYMIIGIKKRIG